MNKNRKKGLNKTEGYIALFALIGTVLIGIYGLIDKPILLSGFVFCFAVFVITYYRKLCISCDMMCPFNPNMKFWRN